MTMITADKLSNAEYHATDAISSSDVKMVHSKSLAHWKAKVYKSSPTFDMGTAVHAMCLEAEKNLVMRGPDTRRGKAWSEAYEAAQIDGKTLLTSGDYDLARNVADSVLFHPVGQRMAGPSTINEASFFATDPETGLAIKTRPDSYWEENGVLYDIKTTNSSADPKSVAKTILDYSYHVQAAFYMKVLTWAGYKAERFAFVFVEKSAPPYAVNVTELTPEFLDYGHAIVDETLAKIKEANDAGVYPTGFSDQINVVDLPRWLQQDAAEFNL
jgi:exodeoxyribonuclease VIII